MQCVVSLLFSFVALSRGLTMHMYFKNELLHSNLDFTLLLRRTAVGKYNYCGEQYCP